MNRARLKATINHSTRVGHRTPTDIQCGFDRSGVGLGILDGITQLHIKWPRLSTCELQLPSSPVSVSCWFFTFQCALVERMIDYPAAPPWVEILGSQFDDPSKAGGYTSQRRTGYNHFNPCSQCLNLVTDNLV